MHVKKGDNVIVISGAHKGKTGKIIRSFPDLNKVIVEGVNVHKKHQRPRRSDQKGQIIDKAEPIHASNVALADSSSVKSPAKSKKPSAEKRVRAAKKSE